MEEALTTEEKKAKKTIQDVEESFSPGKKTVFQAAQRRKKTIS